MPSSNGIERIACGRAAAGAAVRLPGCDLAGLDAVLLSGADADRLAVLDQHDRVRLHVPAQTPRELEVAPLLGGRCDLGDDAPVVARRREVMGVLHEEAARDLPEVASFRRGCGRFEDASVLALLLQRLDRARLVAGRNHDVGLRAGDHAFDGRVVDGTVQRDDAAERGLLVALERAPVGVREHFVDGDSTRVRVLDDRAHRTVTQIMHELPGGVGVVVVEVGEREPAVLHDVVPPARRPDVAVTRAPC